MNSYRRSVGVMLVVGVAVALALVEYGSAGAITRGAQTHGVAVAAKKQETKKQKLAKALKACKKDKSKSKRKKCETAAKKKYKHHEAGTHDHRLPGRAPARLRAPPRLVPQRRGPQRPAPPRRCVAATTGAATTGAATTGAATTGAARPRPRVVAVKRRRKRMEKATHASEMPSTGLIAQGKGAL